MMRALPSLVALIRKELIQAFRDRRMLFMLLMVPVVQVIVFGYAANLEFNHALTVIVDHDRTMESRDFADGLAAEGTFSVRRLATDEEALRAMSLAEAHVVVIIPRQFAERVNAGLSAEVQVLVDGSEPTRAIGAAAAVQAYTAGRGMRVAASRAALGGAPPIPRITLEPRLLYNPSLKSRLFMVPGTAASILLIVTTIVTAMGLARERELGTMEQLLVTPIHPVTLMVGKTVPYALFGLFDEALILVVGNVLFDVPLRGSLLLVFAGTVAYLMATLSMGLLISTFARTQQQAIMGGFFFLLPALLLSGFITPIEAMPSWIRPITYLIPVRYFIEIIRGTLLRGATIADLGQTLLALTVLGVSYLLLAAWRFQRTIA
jgi:ABC-2 type transport system permease protein